MIEALAAILGAALLCGACYAAGALLIGRLGVKLDRSAPACVYATSGLEPYSQICLDSPHVVGRDGQPNWVPVSGGVPVCEDAGSRAFLALTRESRLMRSFTRKARSIPGRPLRAARARNEPKLGMGLAVLFRTE